MSRRSSLGTVKRYRHQGAVGALQSLAGYALLRSCASMLRQRMTPGLRDLVGGGDRAFSDAPAFVAAVVSAEHAEHAWSGLVEDYRQVLVTLEERYSAAALRFPGNWAVGEQSGLALYLTVRLLRPRAVLETGVANGQSSLLVLSALEANGTGRLISVDVADGAGALVPNHLRSRWTLHVLRSDDPIAELSRLVSDMTDVDLFFHDADHSYLGQRADYDIADRVLARSGGGVLLSDDVDESFAFVDHARRKDLSPAFLVDTRKVMGGCRISSQAG